MENYARSDLACECLPSEEKNLQGAVFSNESLAGFCVSRLEIQTEEAERELGKPRGRYISIDGGKLNRLSASQREALVRILAGELRGTATRLTKKVPDGSFGVFVAGLGNIELTADAIGPKTVRLLTATRHLQEHDDGLFRRLGCSSLSALAPGVLGQTGIETLELLQGAVRSVRPDVVIVVDALAARSCARLAATVQIGDVGISPGSGVGNRRAAITEKTLGVPVIAVGVPTVVNSATLVYDALHEAGVTHFDESLRGVLENGRSFFVSPKESDVITEEVAHILSGAISQAFLAGI